MCAPPARSRIPSPKPAGWPSARPANTSGPCSPTAVPRVTSGMWAARYTDRAPCARFLTTTIGEQYEQAARVHRHLPPVPPSPQPGLCRPHRLRHGFQRPAVLSLQANPRNFFDRFASTCLTLAFFTKKVNHHVIYCQRVRKRFQESSTRRLHRSLLLTYRLGYSNYKRSIRRESGAQNPHWLGIVWRG